MEKLHVNNRQEFERLRLLSTALDSKFEVFGIRFGLDAIIGLVPVVGDLVTSGMSIYIIARAAQFGCGPSTLIRMMLNLLVENVIDMVPFLGNIVDVFWKANNKNMELLETYIDRPRKVTLQSRLLIIGICLFLLLFLVGSAVVAVYALEYIIGLFSA